MWLETIEPPYERHFEVAGHVFHFHQIVLARMVNCHDGRPCIEYIVGLQSQFAAAALPKLPFDAGIHFPHSLQVAYPLERGRDITEIDRQRHRTLTAKLE